MMRVFPVEPDIHFQQKNYPLDAILPLYIDSLHFFSYIANNVQDITFKKTHES